MKTYKEMTESVVMKAKAEQKRRSRTVGIIASAAVVVCFICTVAVALQGQMTDGTAKAGTLRESRLVLMCAAAEFEQEEALVEGVITPLKYLVRVRDIRGVVLEAERAEIDREEAAINKELLSAQSGAQGEKGSTRWGSKNTIVSLVQNEFLYIMVADYEQVLDMSVKTTDAGCATVVPYPYERTDENGAVTKVDTGIHINWSLSDATINRIDADPDMKLSEISDTVTVTVNFKDGTTETVKIELTADDEGHIHVTHKGTVVSK